MSSNETATVHDLAIVGPIAPPYGGVSIHLKRLVAHLDRAGVDYIVYDISSEGSRVKEEQYGERLKSVGPRGAGWLIRYLFGAREPVIYVHSSRWDVWAATWLLSRIRGKTVIIAVHTDSLRRLWPVRGRLARRSVIAAFRAAKRLVAVNSHIRDFLEDIAHLADKTDVIPAFVEPIPQPDDEAAIDPAVRTFCETHHPVILANGAPIVYDDGRDLYGIDMCIELVDRLRRVWPQIGLVWYTLKFTGWSPEYAEQMTHEVKQRGLTDNWLFVEPTGEMYPVFQDVELFVRPTCSDGDAVSIREALHFRTPVVASDAAPRPRGCILFATRDQDDFVAKVRHSLETLDEQRAKLADLPAGSSVADEIALLQRVIEESRR